MPENHPTEFVCPGCGSGYKVVRVKADADLPRRLIHCTVCRQPLAPTDGDFVLKYFLVGRARKRNGVDLRMKYSTPRPATRPTAVEDRPLVHQQQQVQPNDDDKKD
jgi:hypothetical protein